jgi:membrane protein YdbS with pleckstrin-like domain
MMADMSKHGIVWDSYPSWSQFSWLYLISLLVALRGALFWQINLSVGVTWLIGAVILLLCAAIMRRWGHYELTREYVRVRNGYTGRTISVIPLAQVGEVELWRGPIASLFGIGTVVIRSEAGKIIRFRGVAEPGEVKARIEAVRSGGDGRKAVARLG